MKSLQVKSRPIGLIGGDRSSANALVPHFPKHISAVANVDGIEINPHQRRILKKLMDIEPKLANMYLGGLRVLLDEGNPERIVQSAHSIREATARLSDMGKPLLTKEDGSEAKKANANNARQLETLFDPLGGVRWLDSNLYDIWNKEFHQFFVEVSHHRKEPSFDEYRAELARYEQFLSSYVLPLQTEIYDRIDQMLANGPDDQGIPELKLLLTRNVESYRYFFRKADARWLELLQRHMLLTANWAVADYLGRIAANAPDEVMSIIESLRTVVGDLPTQRGLIDAANKMPPASASRIVRKLVREKWLEVPQVDWLSYPLNVLLQALIDNSLHQEALQLAGALLAIRPMGPDSVIEVKSHISSHCYEKTLDRFSTVPAAAL